MKPLRLNITILSLWFMLGILSGCAHKKPALVIPPQPPATAAAEPSPTPEPSPAQPATDKPQEQTQQTQTTPSQQTQPENAQNDRAKHPKKPSPRHPVQTASNSEKPAEATRSTPPRKVIPAEKAEPTPPPGQISPGPTPVDATHDQTSTEQLLQSAESNLSGIKRTLSKEEEAMRAQIKEFINQSRKATTENDLARAHILAVKARLLSDELVKQR
jgi:outer membrane biosynthesis protein TonB